MDKVAYKTHHQCKLQVMTTMSAGYVFALLDNKKTNVLPARVEEGQDHLGSK